MKPAANPAGDKRTTAPVAAISTLDPRVISMKAIKASRVCKR